jgi:hypothetical protein
MLEVFSEFVHGKLLDEVESYSLNRVLGPSEPRFLLFRLGNDAARAPLSRPLQQFHPESKI